MGVPSTAKFSRGEDAIWSSTSVGINFAKLWFIHYEHGLGIGRNAGRLDVISIQRLLGKEIKYQLIIVAFCSSVK